jgi:rRNA-processing protein FCF1
MKVVLDTNFLIFASNFKVDLFLELKGNELFVTEPVLEELRDISAKKGRDAAAARLALKTVEEMGLKILESKEREADASLLDYGKQGYAIATQDKNLKEKLKRAGAKIIFIRQKKYVVFE